MIFISLIQSSRLKSVECVYVPHTYLFLLLSSFESGPAQVQYSVHGSVSFGTVGLGASAAGYRGGPFVGEACIFFLYRSVRIAFLFENHPT